MIQIECIASQKTAGHWTYKNNNLLISVTDTGHPEYNILIAIHELIEATLCKAHGFTHYHTECQQEHDAAKFVEQFMAHQMGINWNEYQEALEKL